MIVTFKYSYVRNTHAKCILHTQAPTAAAAAAPTAATQSGGILLSTMNYKLIMKGQIYEKFLQKCILFTYQHFFKTHITLLLLKVCIQVFLSTWYLLLSLLICLKS